MSISASSWLQLANRTAIITGSSSGIGRAVAQTLYDVGCHVILADVHHPTTSSINSSTSDVHNIQQQEGQQQLYPLRMTDNNATTTAASTIRRVICDVTQRDQVDSLMEIALHWSDTMTTNDDLVVVQQHQLPPSTVDVGTVVPQQQQPPPPASILVNCAGIIRDSRVEAMSEQEWDDVINVNLKGTFHMCQSFLQQRTKHVLCTSPASIVNIGSVASQQGNYGQVNYAASKGGIVGLTKALAKEVARRNVRVNAILPGFINTAMAQKVPERILSKIIQKIPMQRMGRPDEVANVIAFLASERSSYLTGTTIECSGMISL
jgi:NAD(P)-dependent dehydrogenase (short-subunit alcohol dehydrogenase family)